MNHEAKPQDYSLRLVLRTFTPNNSYCPGVELNNWAFIHNFLRSIQ